MGKQSKQLNSYNTIESITSLLVLFDFKRVNFAINKRLIAVMANPLGRTVLIDSRVHQAGETSYRLFEFKSLGPSTSR